MAGVRSTPNFTWPGGAEQLGPNLANIVRTADQGDYAEIEKTAYYIFNVGENGERVGETVRRLRELSELGMVTDVEKIKPCQSQSAVRPWRARRRPSGRPSAA